MGWADAFRTIARANTTTNLLKHQRRCAGLPAARRENKPGVVVEVEEGDSDDTAGLVYDRGKSWAEYTLMVAEDARPFSLGETPRFHSFLRTVSPKASIPSPRTVARRLAAMYIKGYQRVDTPLKVGPV
jgi:hypothetical protein